MTIKEQINMRPFKKYVTCKSVFFTPFNILPQSHFDNFTPSVPMCYSLKLTNKILNEKKKNLLYMAASPYHVISKKVENET